MAAVALIAQIPRDLGRIVMDYVFDNYEQCVIANLLAGHLYVPRRGETLTQSYHAFLYHCILGSPATLERPMSSWLYPPTASFEDTVCYHASHHGAIGFKGLDGLYRHRFKVRRNILFRESVAAGDRAISILFEMANAARGHPLKT